LPKEPPNALGGLHDYGDRNDAGSGTGVAQTHDPNYPVCLQTYAIGGGSIDCSFASLTQCAASASGRAAQRLNNAYFAQRDRKPSRQRGVD